MFDVANEPLLVDLRDIASLLKYFQRTRDELWEKLESLLEQAIDNLFAVDIENFFQMFANKLLEYLLNIIIDLIIEQGL